MEGLYLHPGLGIPQSELGNVAGEREVRGPPLELLPLQLDFGSAVEDGWMETAFTKFLKSILTQQTQKTLIFLRKLDSDTISMRKTRPH